MQEVFSRSDDPKTPPREQEFYELRLFDSESAGNPIYCVREAHAQWSDKDGQIMWDNEQVHVLVTLESAKKRYAKLRLALVQRGFIVSVLSFPLALAWW
jgi:hypothetical protein